MTLSGTREQLLEGKERAEDAINEAAKVRLPIRISVRTTSVMGRSIRLFHARPSAWNVCRLTHRSRNSHLSYDRGGEYVLNGVGVLVGKVPKRQRRMSRFRSKPASSWTLLPAGWKYLSGRVQDTAFAPLLGVIGFGVCA